MDDVYFDGDPEHDSRRRHLERVLKGGPPRRRWPWVLAILGGGAWTAWRMMQSPKRPVRDSARAPVRGSAESTVRESTEER